VVGALIEGLKMMMETSEFTERLWDNARYLKAGLKDLGYDIGHSETPITPVMIGDEARTMAFSKALMARGVFGSAIVFPTVPKGAGRIRLMVSAAHTQEQLDRALEVFKELRDQV
jgi:glycine C-acetyltransferase